MNTPEKVENKYVVVQWPEPAHLQLRQNQSVETACGIEFADGKRLAGMLTHFTGRDDYLIVKSCDSRHEEIRPVRIELSAIKQMQLTDLVNAKPYADDSADYPLSSHNGAHEALIVACSATPDAATQAELNRLAGMRVVAVIATADEISVKQNELYRSRTVDTANGPSSDAEKQPVADPDSSDSSVARLFENEEPIELVEHSELGSERALLLLVAQRMLAAAMQGGVLDIHVETEAGRRRTNISFRRVPDSGAVQNSL